MNLSQRLTNANRARQQLGTRTVLRYALYQLGLRSGYWRRKTSVHTPVKESGVAESLRKIACSPPKPVVFLPNARELNQVLAGDRERLLQEADEIVQGKIRLYGASVVPLDLSPQTPLVHWSEAQKLVKGDIKDIWEPSRFGWAFILGRAYRLSAMERYSQTFWEYFRMFRELNPYNLGANWASGQEVALRILALSFAWQVFQESPHTLDEQRLELVRALYEHSARIPPTLIYARSQKNNHLISEALGLYTAGWILKGSPGANKWLQLGWQTLNEALDTQIVTDGTYTQHSMNYHRLMLHAALWGQTLNRQRSVSFPQPVVEKLTAASRWLLAQVDPKSGHTPNLGANDGALILPLSTCEYSDYRPLEQAVSLAFMGIPARDAGSWNELSLWLGLPWQQNLATMQQIKSPAVLRLGDTDSWASLRAVKFTDRPSHADQLHVELWWQGENIAIDAGTYRYNAPSPWDNSLACTTVHNTIEMDGQDQMARAGRFLWLDWAQASVIPNDKAEIETIIAEHAGYKALNMIHRRKLVRLSPLQWLVEDHIHPIRAESKAHNLRLHWLVPDFPFTVADENIDLRTSKGLVRLSLRAYTGDGAQIIISDKLQIIRAGMGVYNALEHHPTLGWVSPTYAFRKPALSILISLNAVPPIFFRTQWNFYDGSK